MNALPSNFYTPKINRLLAPAIVVILLAIAGFANSTRKVLYDGVTGNRQWYVCTPKNTTMFEKEKKAIAYINQAPMECFGLYFDPADFSAYKKLHFTAAIENSYPKDSVWLYVSLIDTRKYTTAFRHSKHKILKGSPLKASIELSDILTKEPGLNAKQVSSILYFIESKREGGFWGNVVVQNVELD